MCLTIVILLVGQDKDRGIDVYLIIIYEYLIKTLRKSPSKRYNNNMLLVLFVPIRMNAFKNLTFYENDVETVLF